jgi:uncharacterized surface protein with fasciclin (FAS1) repeats
MTPDLAPLGELEKPLTDPADRGLVEQPEETNAHVHDILTTAEGLTRLGVFVDFMRAAGLSRLLLEKGPFTVFAPTDRAFTKMSLRERDKLLADTRRLREVMRGHVVAGRVPPPSSARPTCVVTVDGKTLVLTSSNGAFHVANIRLVQTSIPASNGIIHAIDSVLIPT